MVIQKYLLMARCGFSPFVQRKISELANTVLNWGLIDHLSMQSGSLMLYSKVTTSRREERECWKQSDQQMQRHCHRYTLFFSTSNCIVCALSSFRFLLICHHTREAFLTILSNIVQPPHHNLLYISYIFTYCLSSSLKDFVLVFIFHCCILSA